MCSSLTTNLSGLITPGKSPIINLRPSSLIVQRLTNSPQRALVQCSKTDVIRRFKKFLSPSDFAPNAAIFKEGNIPERYQTEEYSIKKRNLLPPNGVARCLFSPRKPIQKLPENYLLTQTRIKNCHHQNVLPSFDTPHRKLLTPKQFSKIFKGFVLGRGSYGVVVKGKYKNRKVAVKIIKKVTDQPAKHSLKMEKNALRLRHPNIVRVFHVVAQENVNIGFVFMELYSHTNLESLLQTEKLLFSIKLKYLKEIGSALNYCHKNYILHLDVKPKNILVNPLCNTCKLCDFGGSTIVTEARKVDNPAGGTLKYSAPELLKGETPSEKADIYSFGITMWEIIYQEIPYDNEDVHVVVYKVVTQNYRPGNHLTVRDYVIEPIYKACWEADPSKRPSMSCVIATLEEVNSDTVKKYLL